jgi:hypothetical protein
VSQSESKQPYRGAFEATSSSSLAVGQLPQARDPVTIAVNMWFDMDFGSPAFAYYSMLRTLMAAAHPNHAFPDDH